MSETSENEDLLAADRALTRQAAFKLLPEAEQVRRMALWLMYGGIGDTVQSPPRPMTGFLATLTPEQRTSALQGYEGDDTMGDRSKI